MVKNAKDRGGGERSEEWKVKSEKWRVKSEEWKVNSEEVKSEEVKSEKWIVNSEEVKRKVATGDFSFGGALVT